MKYVPKRDYRFEYLWEAIQHIEEEQCGDCKFKSGRKEYPMCFEVEAEIIKEDGPVEAIDDLGNGGLYCTKFKEVI